jgi:GNAT superfamily N-acetyltransferase
METTTGVEVVECAFGAVSRWRGQAAKESSIISDLPGCRWLWVPDRACVCLLVQRGSIGRMRSLFVVPEFRRQGLGSLMVSKHNALAEDLGCSAVDAFDGKHGLGFDWYVKHGWKPVGENGSGYTHFMKVL